MNVIAEQIMPTNIRWLKLLLILPLVLLCTDAFAGSRVAFLEVFDQHGRRIQYEPESRFGHTALEVDGMWLQSYPGEGVQLISWEQLQDRGQVTVLLTLKKKYSLKEIEPYLGRAFDFAYLWDNEELYCSELLALVLGIPPQGMQFNRKVWPKSYWSLEGLPGISPDKLYRALKRK